MARVFRLYKGGTETYEGWNESPAFPYNSTNRDTIEDPEGASARHEITSIPSPFARIDLVKTAFMQVSKMKGRDGKADLDGNTIFHKMVSDTLDVGEIFFNIDKYVGKIEIIAWEAATKIAELMEDGNESHYYLGDALKKYMGSDAQAYNFEQLRNIYLLNYLNGPKELNIIGATSPSTLFFSSANKLDYVDDVFFNEDLPFDDEYQPLYKRDFEYVKAWFTLRKTIPNFAKLFPEVDKYLEETYNKITDIEKKTALRNVGAATLEDFEQIEVRTHQQINNVEVLGFNLLKKVNKRVESEFTIQPTREVSGHLPLVLPIEKGNKYSELAYASGRWGDNYAAPYRDEESDIESRVLPFDGSKCPYLTICDLLEDTLIKVPHTLNEKGYFSGNLQAREPKLSYLIPVKPLLLKYFKIEDLTGELPNGYKMFEMSNLAGGSIKVTLRVPVRGNGKIKTIDYSRIYYNEREADMTKNEGGIKSFDFAGQIMPLVNFSNPSDAYYNVSCVSTFSRKYFFKFLNADVALAGISDVCRNEDGAYTYKAVNYTVQGSNFEYIQISDRDNVAGLIVPKFKNQRSINSFDFAVDLGTSNTHIEYKTQQDREPKAFDYDVKDPICSRMFIPYFDEGVQDDLIDETQILEKDFLPLVVGASDYKLPTRTVLSCTQSIDWKDSQEPFGLYNIPLTYDKRRDLPYNDIRYNIKWGKGDDQSAMEGYVRCLMLTMRNKVLLSDGDLRKTNITWFYPISMAPNRVNQLKTIWDRCYQEMFNPTGRTNPMTESAAPIVYYFSRYGTATNLINVDMGGGTTDIAFAKDMKIQYVTSFKYATNVLFEDSFTDLNMRNGIVDFFKEGVLSLLQEKKVGELVAIFNSPINRIPSNMASFLFSLKDNTIIEKENINKQRVDFNALLQEDDDFKIVFLLYYVAIIHHIAHIVKVKKLPLPRHIAFSGNGSKVIRIITSDKKLLARLTKLIFENVIGTEYTTGLDILGLDDEVNPKETTCKGGVLFADRDDDTDDSSIIIMKGDNSGVVGNNDTYSSLTQNDRNKTIAEVEQMFDFAFNKLNEKMDLNRNFGISKASLDLARKMAEKNLDLFTYLDKGIAQRKEDEVGSNKIEESTFFYPIKGFINDLSLEIHNTIKSGQ